jgi:phospholipase A1
MKAVLSLILLLAIAPVAAQTSATPAADPPTGWQLCAAQTQDASARLACYDRWVQGQPLPTGTPASAPAPADTPAPAPDCRSGPQTTLSRYWELEAGSDCGRFNIRGYKPISLSWVHGNSVNTAPSSDAVGRSATSEQPYMRNEMRIQLSVRTKVASGLLPILPEGQRDSLWFGYSQQSYWQLFNGEISRPFRTTDHEPEITYILPTPLDLPGGWRLRYSGLSLNHQSNGQTLPLSRSWNRLILMAGMEKDHRYTLTGRLWKRVSDGDSNSNSPSAGDDNPGIDDTIGRAEVTGSWQLSEDHTLALRHSLRTNANGSWRVEWLSPLDRSSPGLRLHVQLFSGYGDALVDYNRRRTLLSVGLSLVDW